MSIPIALAGLCVAGAVGTAAYQLIRPPRGIARQVAPYTTVARAHLGVEVESLPEPLFTGEVIRRVLGPLGAIFTRRLAKTLGLSNNQALDDKLRQAGHPWTLQQYRRRHLQYSIGGPIASALIGLRTGSTLLVVLFMAGGAFAGARRMPERLTKLTKRRRARMRSDLPTVAWMLTPKIRNHMTVVVAVTDLVKQGSGPVIDDLARAVGLIASGLGEKDAFELIGKETPEPAAARFYTTLAVAAAGGIDLAPALLEVARELRTQRREEVEQDSAKRQIAMVIPDLVFMAPALIVFLLAPLPRLLFGH